MELAPVFGVLSRQLQDIASDAEQAVTGHIALHSHEQGLEGWISQGQKYLTTGLCPFCGVSLDGNELIAKYQSYFNEAYRNLKDQIANLSGDIDDVVPATFVDRASSNADTNEARITVWNDDIALSPPKFDREVLTAAIGNARQALIDSAERKEMNPLEPACDQATELVITNQIELANAVLVKYNADIKSIVDRMSEYKSQVADHDVSSLRNELRDIELSARLTTPQIADARKAFLAAQKEKRRLENEKDAARESGDQTIKTNLQDYETKINAILKELGADFVISKLSQDYRGGRGAPRAGYVIEVRSKLVSLNTSPDFGSRHNFATTLSEADKRTLALAVFIARLDSEADLASKMVVLDDPVSSMDRNRRHQTVNLVAELAGRCQQLVVLSHDPHFLRMLNDLIGQSNQSPVKTLQIRRVQNGYSTFANCDLDELCASAYYRHFHMLEDFVHGTTSADPRDVAKAIRPLLEGFLHRRYPGHITRNQMLGRIISDQIKPATKGPFAHLQKSIAALEAINVYARQFQHDENPESESAIVADAELLHFATKTLDFIYGAP